ncbi:MAG: minichromosome maintenance protein MCM [Candidatus Aenigmarchaeota archaeon]|nr:minichromosome maintenance protein MCM [Candidatus Aenigmarchaeota archaeon]
MELIEKLAKFVQDKCAQDLAKALNENSGLVVDFSDLDRFDPITADMLLEDPVTVIKAFEDAVRQMADEKVNIRIKNLPESRNIRIRSLRAKHLGKLWTIDAVIRSASEIKPQIYEALFECPDCLTRLAVPQDGNIVKKPAICNCGRRGDFTLVSKKMFDMRYVFGIEPFEITSGEQPGSVAFFLKEDLTTPKMQRKTDPGARLRIVGILKELPKTIKGRLSTKMDIYVEVNHVETSEIDFDDLSLTADDEEQIQKLAHDSDIYEKLKMSIAPAIYGHDEIKESVVMQLFGGVQHTMPDGSKVRGNIHILLTGDPGIGKTQILKLVTSIVPRGKYVSGTGASAAGLTAAVRKDEILGGWVLEAGALILANKSIIGIDEFDKIGKEDLIAMHEAMSIETVSIAKASIIATLPSQTAVLAAANPKYGRFDPYQSVAQQIQIPETLLSRFDLKFALRDIPDKDRDEKLADHVLLSRMEKDKMEPIINRQLLRKYIAYAKKHDNIQLTDEAAQEMKKFYIEMRSSHKGEDVPTIAITLRQYEALIRLAEASAKIRLDTKVRAQDSDRAIRLMKFSLYQLGYDYETGKIDVDRLESNMTANKRRRIAQVLEIIEGLQKTNEEGVSIEDIRAEAETQGIEQVDEIIERLRNNMTIFEPKAGFIRKL